MDQQELLTLPLKVLGFSKKFRDTCSLMQKNTLGSLLAEGSKLQHNKHFSYQWLEELVRFLQKNNMLHLLQPLPGSKSD